MEGAPIEVKKNASISKERITNVFALAKEIKPLIGDQSDEAAQKTKDFLEKVFPGAGYTEFSKVINDSQNENLNEGKKRELSEGVENIGGALLIAGGNKVFELAKEGALDSHMASGMEGVSSVVDKNLFIDGKDDSVGRDIVRKLAEIERINRKVEMAPAAFADKRNETIRESIEYLFEKFDSVNSDSVEAGKLGAVIGSLDSSLNENRGRRLVSNSNEIINDSEDKEVDLIEVKKGGGGYYDRTELNESDYNNNPERVLARCRELLDMIENFPSRSTDLNISEAYRPLYKIQDTIRLKLEEKKKNGERTNYDKEKLSLEDIHEEILARLALHDTTGYMEDSNYILSERGGIAEAATKAWSDGRELTRDRLQYILRNSSDPKFGLPIARVWNEFQAANFNYESFLIQITEDKTFNSLIADWGEWKKINGSLEDIKKRFYKLSFVGTNGCDKGTTIEGKRISHFMDGDDFRKSIVDKYIVEKVRREYFEEIRKNYPKKNLEDIDVFKALQLTQKLISASGERSVFNFGLIDGDSYSEVIHFAYCRADDARKGKGVGAKSNRLMVQSLTSGWFRSMSDVSSVGEFRAEDIKIEDCQDKKTFKYYFIQMVGGKALKVKEAFANTTPSPKDIVDSASHFNNLVDNMNKLDPPMDVVDVPGYGLQYIEKNKKGEFEVVVMDKYREKEIERLAVRKNGDNFFWDNGEKINSKKSWEGKGQLRTAYALGLLELAAMNPKLGWTPDKLIELKRFLVEVPLSDLSAPFLSRETWNYLLKQPISNDGKRNFTFIEEVRYRRRKNYKETFWVGFFNRFFKLKDK